MTRLWAELAAQSNREGWTVERRGQLPTQRRFNTMIDSLTGRGF